MLDDRVRRTLARLEAEDEADREAGLPSLQRSLPVGPEAGADTVEDARDAGMADQGRDEPAAR